MQSKSLSGILAFLPAAGMVVYFTVFIRFMMAAFFNANDVNATNDMVVHNVGWIIVSALLISLVTLGSLIYYIIHVVNNHLIDSTERIIWILIFVFAGMIGFPVYWWIRIRPIAPPAQ